MPHERDILAQVLEQLRLIRIPLGEWLRVSDVASKLRVSPKTVRRWIEQGELKAVRLQCGQITVYRIRASDVEAFLNGKSAHSNGQALKPARKLRIPQIDY